MNKYVNKSLKDFKYFYSILMKMNFLFYNIDT